jgi:glycosyltransferase involved in cell wall biosynthesis
METKKKLKVLFIGPYPPPYAGPELGMKLFLESSLRREYDIVFLNTNVRKSSVDKGRIDMKAVIAFFRFFFLLTVLVLRHRPKLVYYPVTATQLGWLGRDFGCLVICWMFRIKTVIHLRCGHFNLNYSLFNPLVKRMVRIACGTVSVSLVQANCLKDQFKGLVEENRIKVLYQAIDTSEYDNPEADDYQVGKILFVGNMTKAKGYCDLVRAIELVVSKHPQAKFYFAGTLCEGERNVFFDQITSESLIHEDPFVAHKEITCNPYKNHYHTLGVVSGDEKIDLLRSSDIFVLPSYSEGFSRALLEAMCVGKPVVCTPVGAHLEVVQDLVHGLLVQPGDVAGLANSICRILDDRELRDKIAHTNYRRAREDFDIVNIANQFSIILENCINES